MFERLREKAGFIDETICRVGEVLIDKHSLEEPSGFGPAMNEAFPTIGRVCCDSEGRLNANSLLLQGTQDLSRGRSLPLDVSQVKEYSLFPGQVIHSSITNPSGTKLVSHSITSDASPKLAPFSTRLRNDDTMHLVVASGPYTTNDNLAYEPFKDLLDYIGKTRPHLVILCGPFVDSKQSQIDECNTNGESFDDIFNRLLKMLNDLLQDLTGTQIILQPSTRDVHHRFIYPTPEFKIDSPRIMSVPDPAILNIDGSVESYGTTDDLQDVMYYEQEDYDQAGADYYSEFSEYDQDQDPHTILSPASGPTTLMLFNIFSPEEVDFLKDLVGEEAIKELKDDVEEEEGQNHQNLERPRRFQWNRR